MEQAIFFIGSEAVAPDVEVIGKRGGVSRTPRPEATGNGVIKNTNAAAKNRVVRNAARLPGKTEPRRPYDAVRIHESLFMVDQNCFVVRHIRVMVDRAEWSGKPGEATSITNRIGLVIRAQSERDRQVGTRMPLILAVEPETVEPEIVPAVGGKGLVNRCVIRVRAGRVRSSKEECVDRLRK